MAVIRPKTLSWDKDGTTYRLRGITEAEETKIGNALTQHQDISGKVDKVTGKGLSTNDYTTAEKEKLAGIDAGANNYTHPSHTAKTSGLYKVTVDNQGHVSAASAVEKSDITGLGIPGSDTTYSGATTETAGLMSAADKTKLDGIATGATANAGTITGITMNGSSKGTSGVVDLGTVITAHQDISGKLNTSLKGAANGLAELDANGKVPSSQLPSYVDDVLEYAGLSLFPEAGESDKIYIDTSTNITYRWSGTAYVPIGSDLAIGETSSTAYRGDRGKIAYDHASTKGSAFSSGMYKITTNSEGHVTAASAVEKSDITGLGIPGSDTTYEAATQSADGLMSSMDKTKLDGIATGANNYTHPSHTAKTSGLYKVTVDNQGHVSAATAVQKSDITGLGIPGSDTTYSAATQSADGLMSSTDKTKLDGIATGANNYTHPSHTAQSSGLYKVTVDNQGHVSAATAVQKSDITGLGIPGSDTTYSAATQSENGLMSSTDKTKLDGIATGANNYTHPSHTAQSSGLYKVTVDNQGHVSAVSAVEKSDITNLGIPGSDTTYTQFTGATSSAEGTAGLVPAPLATSKKKFLCSDGSWSEETGAKLIVRDLDDVTGNGGSYTHTTYIEDVTSDMKAVMIEVSDADVFQGSIDITIVDGAITLECDAVNGTSEVTVSMMFVANANELTSAEFDVLANRISNIANLIYPVGSIYMSVVATSPATLFGGTWERLKSRFLLGAEDAGDTANDPYVGGATGGAKSQSYTPAGTNSGCAVTAHTYTPAGTNSGGAVQNHTLTAAEMPQHNHSFTGSAVTSGGISANHTHTGTSGNPSANHTHSGPSHAHTVYANGKVAVWWVNAYDQGNNRSGVNYDETGSNVVTDSKGTGATGTVSAWHTHTTTTGNPSVGHTHSVTASGTIGNKGSGGAHNHGFTQPTFTGTKATLSHTVTQPTFTGTASTIDTMPPYLSVYMWKRTA